MKQLVIFLILLTLLNACSGIQLLNRTNHYSSEFLKKIESIQLIYKDGDKKLALQKLQNISDENITKAEKAKKYNLLGVMFFTRGNLANAVESFQIANSNVSEDYQLKSQIQLNLASSYYKQSNLKQSEEALKETNLDYLGEADKLKFYRLNLSLSTSSENFKGIVESIVFLSPEKNASFRSIKENQYKGLLLDSYNKLSKNERVYILEKFQDIKPVSVAYLATKETEKRLYEGDKSGAEDMLTWLETKFGNQEEVTLFVKNYRFRKENFSKMNSSLIGLVAPLSGSRRANFFGKKVVSGVMAALKNRSNKNPELKVLIKDNKGNALLAKKKIQELVMNDHVSIIIGGLFPELAREEYLEAKKYGVVYISLSEVYLPRSEKNHLLIEIPGSVESQIETVLSDKNLEYFGKRLAILYPWSSRGKSYVNEIWSAQSSGKIEISRLNHYESKTSSKFVDYRKPVEKLLSLKYPREREEESAIWKKIYDQEKRNFRIINKIPPVVDFDWVFLPSIPEEAIQIIPTFPYYDAKGLKFVGGPSWFNKKLRTEQANLGQMYIVGNDIGADSKEFQTKYKKSTGVYPSLVDTISFEGMNIAQKILGKDKFEKRDLLDKKIREMQKITGETATWKSEGGLWLKEMDILKITKKSFKKVEL